MARYNGKTSQYGGYSCQHNYHGDQTNQTVWMRIIRLIMSVMVTSAINMKPRDYRLKATANDIANFKISEKFLLNILE